MSLSCYTTAGKAVFLILPDGEVIGFPLFQPHEHIVHGVFEVFILFVDFHRVYHFYEGVHVLFFFRPLKVDVAD